MATYHVPPAIVSPVDYGGKQMDHREYPRRLRARSVESLRFIIADASDALRKMPYSGNASYYADEIHYAVAELRRRGLDS